ncbi:M43 family zinc metalloprotease [Flammeovirga sp. SubArs3]|uniref:M43 family zinc metalloprotease n=1 Tax=Flammeovirga sp. SubArs3 TaxID=2995316 RepID=UPI00248BA24E|nr:M43 family zinc metalloprotease [Flammeovirga sp. SubArs3]
MKYLLGLIFTLLVTNSVYSQNTPSRSNCLTTIHNHQFNGGALPGSQSFEDQISRLITRKSSQRLLDDTLTVYYIPVIVHVIHNGEEVGDGANIDSTQVYSQLRVLNEDFRRLENTPGFNDSEIGADVKIEFVPALRDEDENILDEPGIHRHNAETSEFVVDDIEDDIKPATIWDPESYLNMWTVNFDPELGLLGYAQFPNIPNGLEGVDGLPNFNGGATTDGVVMGYQFFGDTLNVQAPYDKGRTTTHEIGHWLGLIHIWGDGDCDVDDYCEDTPNQDGYNEVCVSVNSCGAGEEGDLPDMIENYMDYTPDDCMNIFTLDQMSRMRIIMENSPRRKELLTSNKHLVLEPPVAGFSVDSSEFQINTFVTFTDSSTNRPTSWSWTFEGGSPTSSSDQNPRVQYLDAGTFDVTLITENNAGADTVVMADLITVLGPTAVIDDLSTLSVYPIPVKNNLYLKTDGRSVQEIKLFDITGKEVYSNNNLFNSGTLINMQGYEKNVYILKVVSDNQVKSIKIIKE